MFDPHIKTRRSMFVNSIFGVLSWFLPIALGFVSTPLLVRGLGTEKYGVYAVILGFLSYSFTFGIGRAASKYVSEYSASVGAPEKLSQSLSAVLMFSAVVGFVGAGCLAILTPWFVSTILLLPEIQRPTAEIGLYIASITGLMVMLSQVFQNTLQGTHRFGAYLLISNAGAILLSTGNIALALAGYDIPALLAWNLFSVLTTGILFFFFALRAVPNFKPTVRIGSDVFQAVLKYALSIILYQIFGNLLFIFERTWIVRHFGTETLTFYSVPMLIGLYMHGLISSFALVLFPRFNELLSDRERLIALYRRSNRLVIGVIVFIVATLIVSGREFLTLWVGSQFADRSYILLVVHAMTFALIASNIIVWSIAEAFRSPGLTVVVTFGLLAAGGGLMILVGSSQGIEGIGVARLVSTILMVPTIFYVEKRFLGSVQVRHWLLLWARIFPAGFFLVAAQIGVTKVLPYGWVQFVIAVTAGMAAYGIVLYLTGFFEKDEVERVRAIFSRS